MRKLLAASIVSVFALQASIAFAQTPPAGSGPTTPANTAHAPSRHAATPTAHPGTGTTHHTHAPSTSPGTTAPTAHP